MVRLNTIVQGAEAGGVPLVVAHGLFGSGRNWGAISRRLAEGPGGRRVIAVDMRNHGDSPKDPRHDYEAMADDLAALIAEAAPQGRADVLGHSMGGKAAMVLALRHPDRVRRLVVADIAPVRYEHSQMPYVVAMQGIDLSTVRRRADADAALADAVESPSLRAFLLQNLAFSGGTGTWKLNLDALAEQMPKIMAFPEGGSPFAGPTLFLTGALSDYVRPGHHDRIRALFPAARFEALAGADHWLHADAPEAFAAAVSAFLDG